VRIAFPEELETVWRTWTAVGRPTVQVALLTLRRFRKSAESDYKLRQVSLSLRMEQLGSH